MNKVVVTPAGRRRYLEVLFGNLKRERQDFDRWDIWVNTDVDADVEYCRSLAAQNDWVRAIELPGINEVSNFNIRRFFPGAMDRDSVYVRLDDDIVWVEPGFFGKMVAHRLENRKPFLVFANIVNNAILSHLHQRNGLIDHHKLCGYFYTDDTGWKDPLFAEKVHRSFLNDLKEGRLDLWRSSFRIWTLNDYERVSVNAISWMGSDMADIGGVVDKDEEECLSMVIPRRLGRPNEIFGGAVASHFAFCSQRDHMDKTDVLSLYAGLVGVS